MSAKNKIKEMNDEKKRMLGEADKQTTKDTTNVRAEFKNLDKRSNLLRLASMMKPYAGKMLFCAFLVLMINLAELVKPLAAAAVIDRFTGTTPENALTGLMENLPVAALGIGYFALVLFGALFSVTQARTISRVSQSILDEMRRKVFRKIQSLSVRDLDKYGTGRLITRSTNDVETINEFYSDVFLNLFRDVFLLAGIVVMMLTLDWRLALLSFLAIPVIALLSFSIKRVIKENFRFIKLVTGKINGFFSENIRGMRMIRAFNAEEKKLGEFRELNRQYFKGTMTQVFLNTILRPSMELINTLVIALLVAAGFNRIAGGGAGALEVGVLYAFTNYVKQFFNPINDLAEKYTTVQSAFVSTDRIYELLDEPSEPREGGRTSEEFMGDIEFRNVWFAYTERSGGLVSDPTEFSSAEKDSTEKDSTEKDSVKNNSEPDWDWVLRGVSFHLTPGTRAAFIGRTGAGKSTIISLITRNYDPQRGQVLVDGIDVREWNLHELRSRVAVVLQDVFLFTGHIRENIAMGGDISDKKLLESLKNADALSFLEKTADAESCAVLDCAVAEQGLNFSTGERQLLSFARAMASDPGVLVLDEATAHIDTETERRVQRAIDAATRGRTSICIAHRLSTIRNCDVIFGLRDGVIVEQGTHEELLAAGGMYAEMVRGGQRK